MGSHIKCYFILRHEVGEGVHQPLIQHSIQLVATYMYTCVYISWKGFRKCHTKMCLLRAFAEWWRQADAINALFRVAEEEEAVTKSRLCHRPSPTPRTHSLFPKTIYSPLKCWYFPSTLPTPQRVSQTWNPTGCLGTHLSFM